MTAVDMLHKSGNDTVFVETANRLYLGIGTFLPPACPFLYLPFGGQHRSWCAKRLKLLVDIDKKIGMERLWTIRSGEKIP